MGVSDETVHLSCGFLAPFELLTHQKLGEIVKGKQCLRLGYALVTCGDVYDLKCVKNEGGEIRVSGWVHSEKTGDMLYLTTIEVSTSQLLSYYCPCKGHVLLHSTLEYQLCKHAVAILAALDALRNDSTCPSPPKRFKRKGMGVYKGAPELVQEKVEANLTWPMIINRFFEVFHFLFSFFFFSFFLFCCCFVGMS